MSFADKLTQSLTRSQSLLCLGLDPNPDLLPASYHGSHPTQVSALAEWIRIQIEDSAEWVCAYKPTLGFYQALGVAGIELLLQVLDWIPPSIPVILDAKYSELNSSTLFAETIFNRWHVDAVTLCPFAGQDQVAPFLLHPGKAVFVLCRSASPAAVTIQHFPDPEMPLFMEVAKQAKEWGTPEQVGLEVGAPTPDILSRIRQLAPERQILARSLWAQGESVNPLLAAGLDQSGAGLIIPVAPDLVGVDRINDRLKQLRDQINHQRDEIMSGAACDLWTANVCFLHQDPRQKLILELFDIGCILFGEYVQSSGAVLPYYIDLRTIISNPRIFQQILDCYASILESLSFDRIAGIPYGALPTATGLSLRLQRPMIYPRKEVKAHGTKKAIEGTFHPGETVVVVDDIMISGKSAIQGAEKLKSAGLEVEDIVVFIDHEQGVKHRLREHGLKGHAVLKISEITEILHQAGRLSAEQYRILTTSGLH